MNVPFKCTFIVDDVCVKNQKICNIAGHCWKSTYVFNINELPERCDMFTVGQYAFDRNDGADSHVMESDKEKATEFGKRFNKIDFQCSSFWITRFRQRHNIVFGKISGESSSVPAGVSKNWLEHVWPNLRKNYADCDIYNADETGLFYRLTPSETLRFKGETCSGGKLSNELLTILVASNMTGSYKKKIVDNCPAHPPLQTEFIKLVFLPPNTTSVLQPMVQGIIKALQGKDIKISVFDPILMISDASTTTIRNCFHHAGFKASLNEETEIVSENKLDTECFSEENIQSFAEVDDALLTNEESTKEEIVKSILNANND
ncbi:hypothetical protein QTP88_004538 [Uroleucon formosanum]